MSPVQNVLEIFCLEKLESKQKKGFGSQEPLQTLSVGREELILSCYQHEPLQVKFVFLGTGKSNWNNGLESTFCKERFCFILKGCNTLKYFPMEMPFSFC